MATIHSNKNTILEKNPFALKSNENSNNQFLDTQLQDSNSNGSKVNGLRNGSNDRTSLNSNGGITLNYTGNWHWWRGTTNNNNNNNSNNNNSSNSNGNNSSNSNANNNNNNNNNNADKSNVKRNEKMKKGDSGDGTKLKIKTESKKPLMTINETSDNVTINDDSKNDETKENSGENDVEREDLLDIHNLQAPSRDNSVSRNNNDIDRTSLAPSEMSRQNSRSVGL